jgi:flagellar biosynthesis/type III secretory pathway protein FliH
LRLNGEEQNVFQSELEQLAPAEKERVVEVTNFWEERGRQEGFQRGLQQGREEGGRQRFLSLVRRQIERKFGAVAADVTERISHLNADQLETLLDALLEFSDPLDLAEWLRRL